jgi:hypothetical protein
MEKVARSSAFFSCKLRCDHRWVNDIDAGKACEPGFVERQNSCETVYLHRGNQARIVGRLSRYRMV